MKTIFGIEVSDEEFERLYKLQSEGKILKVIDGKIEAVDYVKPQEVINQERYSYLITWFNTYYTIHEQKFRRLIAMGIDVEENSNALTQLYIDAERVRAEIQNLEKEIEKGEESND